MSRRRVRSWAGLSAADASRRWKRDAVFLYGAIGSTNAAAEDLAEAGEPSGTIVLCREQTAGRGRDGRPWHSPPDAGLYLSMIFRPERPVLTPLASVLAGLGVADELAREFPGLDPRVKWPNDVWVEDRKLAGVLAEASWSGQTVRHLVVGVGVNVSSMEKTLPAALRARATWLSEHVSSPELPRVADAVIRGLERWMTDPPAALDEAGLALLDRYDALRGRRVVLHMTEEEPPLSGTADGLAPDGALLFRPDRGALRRVVSGRVELNP